MGCLGGGTEGHCGLFGQIVGGASLSVDENVDEGGQQEVVASREDGQHEVHDADVGADAHHQQLRERGLRLGVCRALLFYELTTPRSSAFRALGLQVTVVGL
jgi:hypothetical protein